MVSKIVSWRGERSGCRSVTSAKEKSCSNLSACAGRISIAIASSRTASTPAALPPAEWIVSDTEYFPGRAAPQASRSIAVARRKHRIERARGLAFAALGARRLRRWGPGIDVEMGPALRRGDEFAQEQRGGDRARESPRSGIVDVGDLGFQHRLVPAP